MEQPVVMRLTARQTETLELAAQGLTHKEIARQLGISAQTVKHFCTHIFERLNAKGMTHAVALYLTNRAAVAFEPDSPDSDDIGLALYAGVAPSECRTLAERIHAALEERPGGCVQWTGAMTEGRPVLFYKNRSVSVRRFLWLEAGRPLHALQGIHSACPQHRPRCCALDHITPRSDTPWHTTAKLYGPIGQRG